MSNTNITGRTGTHRGIALRCPGCAKPMTAIDLAEANAEVDVCEHCGGMWLDWFDGELRSLARETLRASSPDLNAPASADEDSRRSSEPDAIGACPRDGRQLVPESYVMTADVLRDGRPEKSSLVPGKPSGAQLLRCEECMGAFVSRASAEVLAFLDARDEAPPSQGPASRAEPLPWERFVTLVKAWLGLVEKRDPDAG